MASKSALIASDPDLESLGQGVLEDTGSALAAVISCYFASAGASAGVLLAPAVAMNAVLGGDVRVFDGRLRQPGLGGKRPRGFVADEALPDAAFVAAPGAVIALLACLAYDKSVTPSRVVSYGVRAAQDRGARRRAAVLERVQAVGAAAFVEPTLAHPLLALAAPAQGGMLTRSDLSHLGQIDLRAQSSASEGDEVSSGVPWTVDHAGVVRGRSERLFVAAVDARGRFAGVSCDRVCEGIAVEEIELLAPYAAVPVRRGVPRVTPGESLPSRCALTARSTRAGVPFELAGIADATPGMVGLTLRYTPGARAVEIARAALGSTA